MVVTSIDCSSITLTTNSWLYYLFCMFSGRVKDVAPSKKKVKISDEDDELSKDGEDMSPEGRNHYANFNTSSVHC